MTIRILIADDHGVIRAGLRAVLRAELDLEVIGEAADGNEALRLACELHPDIVLLDVSMPDMGGIEAASRLREKLPEVRTLILTVHEDESLLREAIRAGASGYIIKRGAESEVINAIHVVSRGDMYVHPALTRALLKDLSPAPAAHSDAAEPLTPREIDVLRLIAKGHTSRQIAQVLNISVRTVEGHRANLTGKLGLHSRVELVTYAEERGLLS